MKTHRDLRSWRKAIAIGAEVYAATMRMPSEERGLLGVEMRRLALAASSRIAASSAGHTREVRLEFLLQAQTATFELESLLEISANSDSLANTRVLGALAELEQLLISEITRLAFAPRKAHARACAPARAQAL